MLDLAGIEELAVLVDNTAGTAFRDLTMTSYLDDGTTQIDSFLLRKVAWGLAANGAHHDPGRARAYIGPNPPGGTSGVHVLYDVQGSFSRSSSSATAPTSGG